MLYTKSAELQPAGFGIETTILYYALLFVRVVSYNSIYGTWDEILLPILDFKSIVNWANNDVIHKSTYAYYLYHTTKHNWCTTLACLVIWTCQISNDFIFSVILVRQTCVEKLHILTYYCKWDIPTIEGKWTPLEKITENYGWNRSNMVTTNVIKNNVFRSWCGFMMYKMTLHVYTASNEYIIVGRWQ